MKKVIMAEKKSKTQLLRELQDIVDKFNDKKKFIDNQLYELDDLEKQYLLKVDEIKTNK